MAETLQDPANQRGGRQLMQRDDVHGRYLGIWLRVERRGQLA